MTSIKVFARVRPINEREDPDESVYIDEDKYIVNKTRRGDMRYSFSHCFGQTSTNTGVFEKVAAPLVEQVLMGYNAILIVYGQTGSGKSFSMLGLKNHSLDSSDEGLMPAALRMLAERGAKMQLSAVEAYGIHQQKVPLFDLLQKEKLHKSWQKEKWVQKKGDLSDPERACRITLESPEQVFELVTRAFNSSHVAPTGKNPQSSRGHTVYIAHVKHVAEDGFSEQKCKFVFCDLAGSEGESALTEEFRRTVSAADFRARGMEAACICTGLTDLGIIFDDMRKHGRMGGSAGIGLRRIIHPYMGTNSVVSVMFTMSPAAENNKATTSTLNTALQTAKIKLKVVKAATKVNATKRIAMLEEETKDYKTTIEDLQSEISRLQNQKKRRKRSIMSISNIHDLEDREGFQDKIRETSAFKEMEEQSKNEVMKLTGQVKAINTEMESKNMELQKALEDRQLLETRIGKLSKIVSLPTGDNGIDHDDIDVEALAEKAAALEKDQNFSTEMLKRKKGWEKTWAKSLRKQYGARQIELKDALQSRFSLDMEKLDEVSKHIWNHFTELDIEGLIYDELDIDKETQMLGDFVQSSTSPMPELQHALSLGRQRTRSRVRSRAWSHSESSLPDGDLPGFKEYNGPEALWDEIRRGKDEINVLEFRGLFGLCNIILPVEKLQEVFQKWDLNDNQTIDYAEFEQRINELFLGRKVIQKGELKSILLDIVEIDSCIRCKVYSTNEAFRTKAMGDYSISDEFMNGRPVYDKNEMDENPIQLRFSTSRNMWVLAFKRDNKKPLAVSFCDPYTAENIDRTWYIPGGHLLEECEIEFSESYFDDEFGGGADDEELDELSMAVRELFDGKDPDATEPMSRDYGPVSMVDSAFAATDASGYPDADNPLNMVHRKLGLPDVELQYIHLECVKIRNKYPHIRANNQELLESIMHANVPWYMIGEYLEGVYCEESPIEHAFTTAGSYLSSFFY